MIFIVRFEISCARVYPLLPSVSRRSIAEIYHQHFRSSLHLSGGAQIDAQNGAGGKLGAQSSFLSSVFMALLCGPHKFLNSVGSWLSAVILLEIISTDSSSAIVVHSLTPNALLSGNKIAG